MIGRLSGLFKYLVAAILVGLVAATILSNVYGRATAEKVIAKPLSPMPAALILLALLVWKTTSSRRLISRILFVGLPFLEAAVVRVAPHYYLDSSSYSYGEPDGIQWWEPNCLLPLSTFLLLLVIFRVARTKVWLRLPKPLQLFIPWFALGFGMLFSAVFVYNQYRLAVSMVDGLQVILGVLLGFLVLVSLIAKLIPWKRGPTRQLELFHFVHSHSRVVHIVF